MFLKKKSTLTDLLWCGLGGNEKNMKERKLSTTEIKNLEIWSLKV